jgi:hypothetical protein
MNRFRAWGVGAALGVLIAGTAAPVAAAEPPPATTSDDRPWYKKLFFSPPAQSGPVVRDSSSIVAVPGVMHAGSALPPERVAELQQAERAAWMRRMDVCLRLRDVANEQNNKDLEHQVDELERQVNALYKQRVSALGVPNVKAPLPPPAGAGAPASFSLAPVKPADPNAAASNLTSPGQPVPVGSASVQPGPGVREVKP